MALTPEAKVKNWLVKQLEKNFPSCYIYKAPGGRFGVAGTPDLLCCIDGMFVGIEVKAKLGGTATAIQQEKLNNVLEAKGIALVMDGKNEVRLDELIKKINSTIIFGGNDGR